MCSLLYLHCEQKIGALRMYSKGIPRKLLKVYFLHLCYAEIDDSRFLKYDSIIFHL